MIANNSGYEKAAFFKPNDVSGNSLLARKKYDYKIEFDLLKDVKIGKKLLNNKIKTNAYNNHMLYVKAIREKEVSFNPKLAEFCLSVSNRMVNIEVLDGFFCALASVRILSRPSDFIPRILGKRFHIGISEKELCEILCMVMQHWNKITYELALSSRKTHAYLPIVLEDNDISTAGSNWAGGFIYGVACYLKDWKKLLDDEQNCFLINPMIALATRSEFIPEGFLKVSEPNQNAMELLCRAIASLPLIHRYFSRLRHVNRDKIIPESQLSNAA